MDINTIYLDHNVLQKYYDSNDVNTTCIYLNGIIKIIGYHVKLGQSKKYDTLIISNEINHENYHDMIIGFNIESMSTSKGLLCINEFVVSSFFISKNRDHYPHLILLRRNDVMLIIKRGLMRRVDILTIDGSKLGIAKMYAKYAHKDVKVNNFGPIITYHNSKMCDHVNICTFYDDDDEIIYVTGDDDTKRSVNKIVKITKVSEICKRIIQLLLFDDHAINIDVLMYISTIMYQIV